MKNRLDIYHMFRNPGFFVYLGFYLCMIASMHDIVDVFLFLIFSIFTGIHEYKMHRY